MMWEQGRNLAKVVKGSVTTTYKYNDEVRLSKTVGGVTHSYRYDGNFILSENYTGTTLLFVYDENNSPIGFKYNNDYYVYAKNLQGDIVEIYDNAGNVVTKYVYDAWGNIISTTGSLASTVGAVFRYSGYYWDSETGFYWLQTRYYDLATGRFISADGQLNTNQQLSGYSLYAYCNNNPVMYCDPNGDVATTLILIGSLVAGALAAGHTAAVSYKYTGEVDIQHTFEAFISTFALVYSLGTSAYAMYENFCYYKGEVPKTEIHFGGNSDSSDPIKQVLKNLMHLAYVQVRPKYHEKGLWN